MPAIFQVLTTKRCSWARHNHLKVENATVVVNILHNSETRTAIAPKTAAYPKITTKSAMDLRQTRPNKAIASPHTSYEPADGDLI